ncbi:hypothetical protein [Streptomyces sp. CoH17]|uniref:hypothetical protein n=1 Tax=Streptomyces sp. CoH17 TaxID=2992806 RepID=UPI00226FDDC2|nr:hypothetical protein [Streptomyces sp. CoH17]
MSNTSPQFDEVEALLGSPVESMTSDQMLAYIGRQYQILFGRPIMFDRYREKAILRYLCGVYGNDAYPMIKFFFNQKKGMKDGQKFNMAWFSRKWKWYTDKLFDDYQVFKKAQSKKANEVVYVEKNKKHEDNDELADLMMKMGA